MKKLVVPSLAALDLPANLLEGLAGSAWLPVAIHARMDQHDPWQNIVAAGLIARYGMTDTAGLFLEKFFRGEVDQTVARPRRWAVTWSEDQVKTVVWLFQAEVQMMLDLVAWAVKEDEEPSVLAELCQRRDALECVRTLLVERGRASDIEDILEVLDEAGRELVLALPVAAELHGDWLEAARNIALPTSRDYWWTALVAPVQVETDLGLDDSDEGDPETDITPPDRVPNPCLKCGEDPCQCKRLGLDEAWCSVCERDTAFCRCRPPEEEG
ncbi:MAG: hypothetical protein Q7S49_00385 [bacterium]|nr:hypothetical protein [bacterium]